MFTKLLSQRQENSNQLNVVNSEIDFDFPQNLYPTMQHHETISSQSDTSTSECVIDGDRDLVFVEKFTQKGGKFVYSETIDTLINQLVQFLNTNEMDSTFVYEQEVIYFLKSRVLDPYLKFNRVLESAKVALSFCESLVCSDGNIVLNPQQHNMRPSQNFPEWHIIVAFSNQLTDNIEQAVQNYRTLYQDINPFILDLNAFGKKVKFHHTTPLINSEGTKNIMLFYCEEPI